MLTIEFLRKSASGCTNCRPHFTMRTAIKALMKYGNSSDSCKTSINDFFLPRRYRKAEKLKKCRF